MPNGHAGLDGAEDGEDRERKKTAALDSETFELADAGQRGFEGAVRNFSACSIRAARSCCAPLRSEVLRAWPLVPARPLPAALPFVFGRRPDLFAFPTAIDQNTMCSV